MSQNSPRRRYSKEFKLDAIRLVQSRDGRVTEVAANLGVHPNMLHRWIKEHNGNSNHAFSGNGTMKEREAELRKLKRMLRDAEEEREILKKALAIFSTPQR